MNKCRCDFFEKQWRARWSFDWIMLSDCSRKSFFFRFLQWMLMIESIQEIFKEFQWLQFANVFELKTKFLWIGKLASSGRDLQQNSEKLEHRKKS
jgi:hypothetical protein